VLCHNSGNFFNARRVTTLKIRAENCNEHITTGTAPCHSLRHQNKWLQHESVFVQTTELQFAGNWRRLNELENSTCVLSDGNEAEGTSVAV
jgi:hypothetical protein